MKRIIPLLLVLILLLCACAPAEAPDTEPAQTLLPAPVVDTESQFGVDKNINMSTIDSYLGRDDVVYRDVRMLFDPADYAAIGGDADLSKTIEGFKVVPYPYIATLGALPVANAYEGNTLFAVEWNADGTIASVSENYKESMMILQELFPKDKPIFLMCGGGGYAGMMKSLLMYLGWDENLLYNIGGNWEYTGDNSLELVVYPENAEDDNIYATWRADYAYIDFGRLHEK
ncbi:MAG: hypothetical protein Q4A83_04160 [Bacillota bacterium]|nr:hypothetical protein [Bacillota bacterium]